jgi:hypothetical protein
MRGVRTRQDELDVSGERIPAPQADSASNRGVGRRLEGLDAAGIPLKTDAPQADSAAARGLGQRQIEAMGGADASRVPATQAPSLASGFAAGPGD